MRKSQSSTGSRLLRAGLAAGAATALVVAGAAAPAFAASVLLTLSSTNGPAAGGTTITASSTTAYLNGVTTPVSVFLIPVCPTTYTTVASAPTTPTTTTGGVAVVTTRKLTTSKASVLTPALPVVGSTGSTKYNLCIYTGSGSSAALVGNGSYTVAAAPGISSGAVSPTTGPALGGSLITVTGTALPTASGSISGTLGGEALTSVTPISSTSFTALTPAHAPGPTTLAVTTAAGTQTLASAYTYSNGISISPSTAAAASATSLNPVYVDVLGAGFSNYTFGSAATQARVWLVNGRYDPGTATSNSGAPATVWPNGPTAECTGVILISDTELICSLNLATGALTPSTTVANSGTPMVPDDTYTLTVVNMSGVAKGSVVGYLVSDISSGSTFTVAPY
jgi:hypothetical protein